MRLKKLLSLPWFLLFAGVAFALITITGQAIAEMKMPLTIDIGQRKIGENVEKLLAIVNETITDSLNLTATCLGADSIELLVKFKDVSLAQKTLSLNKNGTTPLTTEAGISGISLGNVTIVMNHLKQGQYSCVIEPVVTNNTKITWVPVL